MGSDEGTISMAGGMAFVNAGEEETATTTEQGLSSGAIAGLVIVGVMFGCLMGALCMVCYQKRNKVVQSGPQMEKVEDEEVMVDVRVTNSMQLEAWDNRFRTMDSTNDLRMDSIRNLFVFSL